MDMFDQTQHVFNMKLISIVEHAWSVEIRKVGFGCLVPQNSPRGIEQGILELISSDIFQEKQRRVLVLSQSNKRASQIANEIEIYLSKNEEKQAKIRFFQCLNHKKVKGTQLRVNWEEQIKSDNIFLMLGNTFLNLLVHGQLQIQSFDFIIFDEAHSVYQEHPYTQIMHEFYYNPVPSEDTKMPFIIAYMDYDNIFTSNTFSIREKLMMISNTFNAKLMAFNAEELQNLQLILAQKINCLTYDQHKPFKNAQALQIAQSWYQNIEQFMNAQRKDIIQPHPEIFDKKRMSEKHYFMTGETCNGKSIAKCTLNESKSIFSGFIVSAIQRFNIVGATNKQLISSVIQSFKEERFSQVSTIQFVQDKQRYFVSKYFAHDWFRIFFQNYLHEPTGEVNTYTRLGSNTPAFKKMLQSQNHTYLELVNLLYKNRFLDDRLYPNEQNIDAAINYYLKNQVQVENIKEFAKQSRRVKTEMKSNQEKLEWIILEQINPIIRAMEIIDGNQEVKVQEEWKINELMMQLEGYCQQFSIDLQSLANMLDASIEIIKLPQFYSARYSKRQLILYLIIAALSQKHTSNYQVIKQEIERLQFLGDLALSLNIVTFLFFNEGQDLSEREMDQLKISKIKTSNFKDKANEYGLQHLLLQNDQYQMQSDDEISSVIQSLGGIFSLYFGINASLLLLQELEIISIQQKDDDPIQNKVLFLKNLQVKQTQVMNSKCYKSDLKMEYLRTNNLLRNQEQKFQIDDLMKFVEHATGGISQPQEEEVKKEKNGYIFKNPLLLVESITHKSYSEKIQVKILNETKCDTLLPEDFKNFNYQRLEYLGDPILNFTIGRLFYFETAQATEQWHKNYFSASKLHDLKTWFSSNNWLAFIFYEHFYHYSKSDDKTSQKFIYAVLQSESSGHQDDVFKFVPRLPLLYDDENDLFHKQLVNYQLFVSQKFVKASMVKQTKSKEKPFGLGSFSISDEDADDHIDFQDVQDHFVKYFSDVFEALIGAVYMDSGNFELTTQLVLKLLKSNYVESFPLKENERTKVLTVWNSKPYAAGLKLSHSLEDRGDKVVVKGYIQNIEVRRVCFKKEQKKKIPNFYRDLRKYLESSYYNYEMHCAEKVKLVSMEGWLEFHREFRRIYNVKTPIEDHQYFRKVAASLSESDYLHDSENQKIQLINQFKEYNNLQYLLVRLEHERVRNTKIREALSRAGLRCLTAKTSQTIEETIQGMTQNQIEIFTHEMKSLVMEEPVQAS